MGPEQNPEVPSVLQKAEPRGGTAKDPHAPQSRSSCPSGRRATAAPANTVTPSLGFTGLSAPVTLRAFPHQVRWLPPPLESEVQWPHQASPLPVTAQAAPHGRCSLIGTACGIRAGKVFLGASVIGYKEQEYGYSCHQTHCALKRVWTCI